MDFVAKAFCDLTLDELYDLLRLRAEVFVVEQSCAYQDLDGLDREATHLLGVEEGRIEACARWYPEADHVHLGRIATSRRLRGRGHGRRLVAEALRWIADEHPGEPILIHAQTYLDDFYRGYGFEPRGEPFDMDGIPHVVMVRNSDFS